jgi:hypothetical protein
MNLHQDAFSFQMRESFAIQLYYNSRGTLKCIDNIDGIIPPFELSKVQLFTFDLWERNLNFFEDKLRDILSKIKTIRIIKIQSVCSSHPKIIETIFKKYKDHCIENYNMENIYPTKIATIRDLDKESEYVTQMEYLFISETLLYRPQSDGWNDYESFFEPCSQLKGIGFCDEYYNDVVDSISKIENLELQKIWKDRIQFIKSLGIKILPVDEITGLQLRLDILNRNYLDWGFRLTS